MKHLAKNNRPDNIVIQSEMKTEKKELMLLCRSSRDPQLRLENLYARELLVVYSEKPDFYGRMASKVELAVEHIK